MRLAIQSPGALTTVQDLGRWGFQAIGMPVGGAMDAPSLVRGNLLLGNPEGVAALEATASGPSVRFEGEGAVAVTGGDLSPRLNGASIPNWTVVLVRDGDLLTFGGMGGKGCRAYLCVAGGIDIPPLMGSRSTYLRAGIGGFCGRRLAAGDVLPVGRPRGAWRLLEGVACPAELRPDRAHVPFRTILGPQDDRVTPEGVRTFFSAEYKVSGASDRMGYRMEGGAAIELTRGSDIVSDGVPMGAVQVPGEGLPIVMMADRQTSGGYVKIGVVHALDVARLSQCPPGASVRFARLSQEEGIELAKQEAAALEALRRHVGAAVRSAAGRAWGIGAAASGRLRVRVDGRDYSVVWERLS